MRIYKTISGVALAVLTPLLCAICVSCVDENAMQMERQKAAFEIVGELVDVGLCISVKDMSASVTRAEEPTADADTTANDAEKHIDDLWVFEYNAEGALICRPQRVEITEQSELHDVKVALADNNGKEVVIYVVANSGSGVSENSANWVVFNQNTESYDGFMTIDDLEANVIPTPHPQRMTWNATTETYVLDDQDANNVSIPMAGYKGNVTVSEDEVIEVHVTRMFAKLLVRIDLSDYYDRDLTPTLYSVTIGNIPEYCTVGTLWDGDKSDYATPADYTKCDRWIQRTFTPVEESGDAGSASDPSAGGDENIYPYLIYIPENIQGEHQVDGSTDKAENVPNANALTAIASVSVTDERNTTIGPYNYTAYPGGNSTTNFNVRRNCVYRVTLKIGYITSFDVLPSANCIVCLSGETTAFWPYCREETGGGYKFTDYLDADDDTGAKRIASVGIIWQSTNGGNTVDYDDTATGYIGDNSNNEYVWIDDVDETAGGEYYRRIHVSIPEGKTGNALIGAYNSNGEIIWSWHIWSRARANDPTVVNTKLYYTYDWGSDGIYSDRDRVAGYTIMNCNLGSMQDDPAGSVYATSGAGNGETGFANARVTFGTLYQWGRKDPFPPITAHLALTNYGGTGTTSSIGEGVCGDYSTENIGRYFDNSNTEVTIVSTEKVEGALFYSVPGADRTAFDTAIPNTIKNPTVFYAGTSEVNLKSVAKIAGTDSRTDNAKYMNENYPSPVDGNWILDDTGDHFNRLWGGLDPELDSGQITKSYNTGYTSVLGSVTLYDDYGEKSIFDPCPYGWRVSPPDLWAGFTSTGLNPTAYSDRYNMTDINCDEDTSRSNYSGMTMYLTDWKTGPTSFFPIQGTRAPDGCAYRVGQCGNYNNATADANDRVNTLHVHYYNSLFHLYELIQVPYFIKSSAGPVRCVKIDSVQQ